MTRATLLSLADRVEAPDADIECVLREASWLVNGPGKAHDRMNVLLGVDAFFEAAVTLAPNAKDSGGILYNVEAWRVQSCFPAHVKATAWIAGAKRTYAATPALALTAAALRARAMMETE